MRSSKMFWVALVAGLVGGAGGSWFSGSPIYADADTVEAGRFVLRGEGGKVAAGLAMVEGVGPALVLKDRNSIARASLSLGEMGEPSIDLYDDAGARRTRIYLFGDGRPAIRLLDRDGQARSELSLGAQGEPGFGLSDRDGKGGVWVYVALDGSRGVGLLDQKGAVRAEMSLKPGGHPALSPFDND